MMKFSRLSDPRDEISSEHWEVIFQLRTTESRRADLQKQRTTLEAELEHILSEQSKIEALDNSISVRLRECENQIKLVIQQAQPTVGDDPDKVSGLTSVGETRSFWVRVIRGPRGAEAVQASGNMSTWLRHYLMSEQRERILLLDAFDIAGLYQDLAHLEGDQAELRLDMLVAVLKLLAEERPDVLRRVVEQVLSMAEEAGTGAERLQGLIVELLQGLELDVRARGRREPPPVASA